MVARLGRWWLDNPGAAFLIGLGVVFTAMVTHQMLFAWVGGGFVLASLVQGLRVLWNTARVKAVLLGVGLPALLSILSLSSHQGEWGLLVFWAPAAAAAVVEALVRGLRRRRGLPEVELSPPPTPEAGRASLMRSLLTGVILAALCGGHFFYVLNEPVWHAQAFKERVLPGMTVGEVFSAADTGRRLVFVHATKGAPKTDIGPESASVGTEYADSAATARALLDRRAADLKIESLSFMYLTAIPVRSSIVVRFSPEGRVTSVEGPYNRAD
jgi:hypothetical protein